MKNELINYFTTTQCIIMRPSFNRTTNMGAPILCLPIPGSGDIVRTGQIRRPRRSTELTVHISGWRAPCLCSPSPFRSSSPSFSTTPGDRRPHQHRPFPVSTTELDKRKGQGPSWLLPTHQQMLCFCLWGLSTCQLWVLLGSQFLPRG